MQITSQILEKAIIFSVEKHKGQVRKGDERPYILHPFSVLQILYKIKKSKNQFLLATACILHDVVEDNKNVTLQDIADEFGFNVAALVEELTSDKDKIKLLGKEFYLLDKMLKMSSYALCIKLCDRLDNICDMGNMNDDFKERTINQTIYILDGLEKERVLTKTHKKIIKLIRKEIKNYEK